MYSPSQKSLLKPLEYTEVEPPSNLSEFVHRFWEIKTDTVLPDDFFFHVLPDACIHIVFNLAAPQKTGVTALRVTAEALNLGKNFHFVGIRFLPGVWRANFDDIVYGVIDTPYLGKLPLIEIGQELVKRNFCGKQSVLSQLVHQLINENIVAVNAVTAKLLTYIDDINTVAGMAAIAGMSPRQLQRTLKQTTGFLPHDFLKILRLQQSFEQHYLTFYADQSHFIHSFRKITGYTPSKYAHKFDV